MSFSSRVKEEMANTEIFSPCCLQAQCYGLLLFSRAFSPYDISLTTENESVSRLYIDSLKNVTGVEAQIISETSKKITVSVEDYEDRMKVLNFFGHTGKELSLRLNRANISKECCFAAFLRGVFLSCGTVSSPEKSYHMEFSVLYSKLSLDLFSLLEELGLSPKHTVRRNANVIYFKHSENIEDVLTVMGAMSGSLELMGIKMNKNMRNKINRRVNFETANISRTVNAAMSQIAAIEKIEEAGGLNILPDNLQELALVRKENPDASLNELGELLNEKLSRSGINHRLARIVEFADNLNASTD